MNNFINRNNELHAFNQQLANQPDKPSIVVLTAPTAYGKSRFTKKLLEQADRESFRVEIPGYDTDKTEQGKFIREISKQLNDSLVHKDKKLGLNHFLSNPNEIIDDLYDQKLINNAFSKTPLKNLILLKEMIERKARKGIWNEEALVKGEIGDSSIIFSAYLISVLGHLNNSIICIENIQQIDRESLDVLIGVVSSPGHKSFLIFEFTESSEASIDMLVDNIKLSKEIDLQISELEPLPRKDFHRLVDSDKQLHTEIRVIVISGVQAD